MTCVAWDGKRMAGDRQGDLGGSRLRVRKVWRLKGRDGQPWLLGGCGSIDLTEVYRQWFTGERDRPTLTKDDSFCVLLVDRRRRVFIDNFMLTPVRIEQRRVAIGSGRGEAMGAMAAGASAERAVKIAASLDSSVGMGVDWVAF